MLRDDTGGRAVALVHYSTLHVLAPLGAEADASQLLGVLRRLTSLTSPYRYTSGLPTGGEGLGARRGPCTSSGF